MVDVLKIAGAFSPFIAKSAAGFWSRNNLSKHIPVNISTVISNVAGPNFPLYCSGARMVDYYGLGVLTPGIGIFHLVFSYSGRVTLSVLADREIMPKPELYHDCLVASYEELYAATAQLKQPVHTRNSAAVQAKAKIESPKRATAEDAEQEKSGKGKSGKGKSGKKKSVKKSKEVKKSKGGKKTKADKNKRAAKKTKVIKAEVAKPSAAKKPAPKAKTKSKSMPTKKVAAPAKTRAAAKPKTARPKVVRRKQPSAPKLKT